MSGRCKCCDIKLFEHEMKEENDGMCSRCIAESGREYNIVNDHIYEHYHVNDGPTIPKTIDY